MSDPEKGFPAWLELHFDKPVSPREIQLIFDTGLHRHLTLSHHDGYTNSKMLWGQPQPETVRDYTIEVFDGQHFIPLLHVKDNYQRRRHHTLECTAPITRLRITAHATNGLNHARICEIRVYE